MADISIKEKRETDSGWIFIVAVKDQNSTKHEVKLYEDDWQNICAGAVSPDELIVKSFEFLLEHEPKESILKKFNLTDIGHYFPEYEGEMKKKL